jgi:3-oxoacyl-[acyl-carrier-protein] synthase-3
VGIGILGIGHAIPQKVLTNHDLAKMVETSDEWISTRTGIRERRIASPSSGTSVLAHEAAVKALAAARLGAEAVELIIVGTTTPDMPLPSCACLVQERLGAKKAVGFDLAAACAGFVFSLATAHQFLANGTYRNVLVIGAEQITPYIDWKDRSTCILFGDAAGACVLGPVPGRGLIAFELGSDGSYADLIKIPAGGSRRPPTAETVSGGEHYLRMNGAEVFKLAVRGMAGSIETVLAKAGVGIGEVALIIPHQANMRIIEAVAERLGVDRAKIFVNLDRYGNTSSASIVLALSEAVAQKRVKRGDLVMLATFGAGLVWGSAILEW